MLDKARQGKTLEEQKQALPESRREFLRWATLACTYSAFCYLPSIAQPQAARDRLVIVDGWVLTEKDLTL